MPSSPAVEAFIARWGGREGGQERANYAYPADEVVQTAVVMAALAQAAGPLDANAIALTFKQGRRSTPKIAAVLASLARMGVIGTSDGGRRFLLRRVP